MSADSDSREGTITVEVAYARPDVQVLETLSLSAGTPLREAIERSGLLERFPEIDLEGENRVGVFGQLARLDYELADGDRVEIYRPLTADPREVRRRRAREGRTMRRGD